MNGSDDFTFVSKTHRITNNLYIAITHIVKLSVKGEFLRQLIKR